MRPSRGQLISLAAAIVLLATALLSLRSLAGGASGPSSHSAPTQARLLFVGDVMLGRYVGASVPNGEYDRIFAGVRDLVSGADIAVGNLEGPLVPPGSFPTPQPSANQPLLVGDTRAARSLAGAGFDLLSLANNHSLDAGEFGLQTTASALEQTGIAPLGLPTGETAVKDVRGLRVAFLAYTLVRPNQGAGLDGSAYIDPGSQADRQRLAAEIREARHKAAVVAVMIHWGEEYSSQPDNTQKDVARIAAEAGADLVVGAHPHVAQGMEPLHVGERSTLVAYSLGNALFDQASRPEAMQGLALDCVVDRDGVRSARLVPLQIRAEGGIYSMSVADDAEGQPVLQRAALSTPGDLQWQATWDVQAEPGTGLVYSREPRAASSEQDLGMDSPSLVELRDGRLSVRGESSGKKIEWATPPEWRVTGYTIGDADGDGRPELVYTLWKKRLVWNRPESGGMSVNQQGGEVLPHIYIEGWRNGEMRPVWHGSPRPAPVLSVAVAGIGKGGKPLLATLDSSGPDTPATPGTIHLWEWTGGFGYELAQTLPGAHTHVWSDGKMLFWK